MKKNIYEVPQVEEFSLEIEGTIAVSCTSGDGEDPNMCLDDEA
jgi:hypothetical protein